MGLCLFRSTVTKDTGPPNKQPGEEERKMKVSSVGSDPLFPCLVSIESVY
jgi:hypothetical protein